MLTLPLVNLIGGGNQQLGFTVTMIIYGVICVGLLLLTFANTRERVFTPKEKEPPFIKSFVAMLHNGPWWILVTLNLVMFIGVVTKPRPSCTSSSTTSATKLFPLWLMASIRLA